jgi:hypothetical protein
MPTIPFPDEAPDAWDICTIGEVELPGVSKVEVSRKDKVDIKPSSGSDGATETDKGADPATVKITCVFGWKSRWPAPLNEPNHWEVIRDVVEALAPRPGKPGPSRNPKAIIHPTAALHGVKSIKILSVTGPKISGKQMGELTIDAVEFFPPPKKVVTTTPAAADPNVGVNNALVASAKITQDIQDPNNQLGAAFANLGKGKFND